MVVILAARQIGQWWVSNWPKVITS